MKCQLVPYYISRAIAAAGLGAFFVLTGGWSWWAGLIMGVLTFAGFLWYAHSGYYLIDPSTPLTPLQRDARGKDVRNRAVVIAVVVGGVSYALLAWIGMVLHLPHNPGTWALLLGVIAYLIATNWLFARG
ncbi:MAG: hypothetical protein JXB30_09975 [Anaerolineae bacterium]|nr:hypothetical protein [Anaerolineae bacterium]